MNCRFLIGHSCPKFNTWEVRGCNDKSIKCRSENSTLVPNGCNYTDGDFRTNSITIIKHPSPMSECMYQRISLSCPTYVHVYIITIILFPYGDIHDMYMCQLHCSKPLELNCVNTQHTDCIKQHTNNYGRALHIHVYCSTAHVYDAYICTRVSCTYQAVSYIVS